MKVEVRAKLPAFERPPVQEVAIGVYFNPIGALDSIRLGLLWERWRDRYPHAEEQPPLPPVVPESFGQPWLTQAVTFVAAASPRIWYQSEARDQLVQVQRDRLVHNWRRLDATQPYPHYDALRPRFQEDAADFWAFIAQLGLEPPTVVQAEVTYVNPIPIGESEQSELMARLIAPWSGVMSDESFPSPEDVGVTLRFRIPNSDGNPIGRLYATALPSTRHARDGRSEELITLQLFARGAPIGTGVEGALAFFDMGHDWLVRGFKSVTTPEAHRQWGLHDNE